MKYEDQLAAARYRAERDQARQELDRIKSDRSWHACADAGMLLSEEDRGAIRWVSEHGGLDAVKKEWNLRGNFKRQLEKAQEKVERQQRHIEFVQGKCHERLVRIAALNKTVAEMRPRLMPEGMEWPRYESGELVGFGDEASRLGEDFKIHVVCLYSDGSYALNFNVYLKGERVKRPAPKVLDADGVPIKEGEVLWDIDTGTHGEVVYAHDYDGMSVKFAGVWHYPERCAHSAPVLAADGRPLREGETVWKVKNGDGPYHVQEIRDGVSVCVEETSCEFMPKELTHERPDSWETLWDDIEACAVGYETFMRRCKALAGVSE